LVGKVEQRVQRVFGLLREHDYSINPIDIIGLADDVKRGAMVFTIWRRPPQECQPLESTFNFGGEPTPSPDGVGRPLLWRS
jgi:hypothetical protein